MGVYNAPEANAYPLASYSYLITPTSGFDPAKGAVLAKWIIYIACAGQQEAAPLGYSPLPPNLVQAVFSAVKRIPGAPTTPPLTPTACPNPTITGQGYGGSPGSGTSSDPQGTTTTTAPTGNGSGGTKTTIDDRRQDAGRGRSRPVTRRRWACRSTRCRRPASRRRSTPA